MRERDRLRHKFVTESQFVFLAKVMLCDSILEGAIDKSADKERSENLTRSLRGYVLVW